MINDLMTSDSPFWEKCARHANRYSTRNIANLFLCDRCAERLASECFNERRPIYRGSAFEGYCGLCNELKEIRLWQWFVCHICLNVVYAYPKAMAASQFVLDTWRRLVVPVVPKLVLNEVDPVHIEPYVSARRSAAKKIPAIDFNVSTLSASKSAPLFLIELKTGPGSLGDGGMTEFQLDVNDYNDIAAVVREQQRPAYIVHAQVTDEYTPPTRRSVARELWWTDMFSLRSALIDIRPRRGEDKLAGYYDPKVFHQIETFPDELKSRGYRHLADRLNRQGIADLPLETVSKKSTGSVTRKRPAVRDSRVTYRLFNL